MYLGLITKVLNDGRFGFIHSLDLVKFPKEVYFKNLESYPKFAENYLVKFRTREGFKGVEAYDIQLLNKNDFDKLDVDLLLKTINCMPYELIAYNHDFKVFQVDILLKKETYSYKQYSKILDYLRNDFNKINIIEILENYNIIYEECMISRPRCDEIAYTCFKVAVFPTIDDVDVYLRKIIPNYLEKLKYTSGYLYAEDLLEQIKASNEEKIQLELKAKQIEGEIKHKIISNYNKSDHFNSLIKQMKIKFREIYDIK